MVGERLVHELRGEACADLEVEPPARKGMAVTRMFSARVEDQATVQQAVAAHAARLGEKLRREGLGADHLSVFYHTSAHDDFAPQRSVSLTVRLPEVTSDTLALVSAAVSAVRQTWRDDRRYRYSKAGIITADLVPLERSQRALPGVGRMDRERSAALMGALDAVNARYGRGALVPAAAGVAPARRWLTKATMRSPRYTTRLGDLPVVRAEHGM